MLALTDLFAGEWLLADPDNADAEDRYTLYRVAYAGLPIDRWSGGVTWRTSREVMEQIIADQEHLPVAVEDRETFFWVHDTLVAYDHKSNDIQTTDPDEDGLYQAPGWTWCQLDEDDSAQAVVPGRPHFDTGAIGSLAAVRVIQECCAEVLRSLEQGETRTERDIAADIIRRLQTAYSLEDK